MAEQLERQLIGLIAADRLDIPISSMSGKLKRMKPKLASAVELPTRSYYGQRVYARIAEDDITEKARTMREAIDTFSDKYPQHGTILNGLIEETRVEREKNLYFGMQPGCRLTADDYLGVMADLGFTEAQARTLYEPLIDTSRKIARKRAHAGVSPNGQNEERSILIR